MTPEERLLLTCTRQNFDFTHAEVVAVICQRAEIDWEMVYEVAVDHHVAPLIYVNLQQCMSSRDVVVPDVVVRLFKTASAQSAIHEEIRTTRLLKALTYFDEQGVDVMLIKSKALDILVYDQPWYTTPQDVDLILHPTTGRFSGAQREFIAELEAFEIECDALSHHDLDMNGILPIDFDRIWRDANRTHYHGHPVALMSPEDMLLALCINSGRKRYLRLKAMCDIAETLRGCEIDWPILLAKARDYRIIDIVYTALWTTDRYLACRVPADVFAQLGVNPVRATIIRQLVQQMTLTSVSGLRTESGIRIFGRKLSRSVVLRYATLRWDQIWRNINFVLRTPRGEYEFWDGA